MKKLKNAMKGIVGAVLYKVAMLAILLVSGPAALMAQNTAGDYTAGTNALTTVAEEIAKYVPIMVKLCYAIAGVVWKSHATLTPLAKQDCPLWLQYD